MDIQNRTRDKSLKDKIILQPNLLKTTQKLTVFNFRDVDIDLDDVMVFSIYTSSEPIINGYPAYFSISISRYNAKRIIDSEGRLYDNIDETTMKSVNFNFIEQNNIFTLKGNYRNDILKFSHDEQQAIKYGMKKSVDNVDETLRNANLNFLLSIHDLI
jgi:hypothetical protein